MSKGNGTLARIIGSVMVCHCDGCHKENLGGTEPFKSASTGEMQQPEDWYMGFESIYCKVCAARLVERDPTRSRSRFYTDTQGENIDPNI